MRWISKFLIQVFYCQCIDTLSCMWIWNSAELLGRLFLPEVLVEFLGCSSCETSGPWRPGSRPPLPREPGGTHADPAEGEGAAPLPREAPREAGAGSRHPREDPPGDQWRTAPPTAIVNGTQNGNLRITAFYRYR